MAGLVPLGSGPPIDDEDEEFDYFDGLTFNEYTQKQNESDDEADSTLRRPKNIAPAITSVCVKKEEKPPGPKSLTFSKNTAQCKRGTTGRGKPQWRPQGVQKVTQRSNLTGDRSNTADCAAFPKKPGLNPKLVENLQKENIKDTLRDIEGIPTGSYEENNSWLRKLEEQWCGRSRREHTAVVVILEQCWFIVENPYVTTLYLIGGTKDYTQGKTSTLSFLIAKEFERWIKPNREKYQHCINKSLRVSAFQVAVRGHFTTLELLSKAYGLKHEGNDYFLPLIDPMLESKKYKEVAQCVAKLGLHRHYKTRDLVMPLILQDKINLVEAYVYQDAEHQLELLKLLDYMVDDDTDLYDLLQQYSHVPDIRHDKMTPKLIGKLAVRLMKLYNITEDVCPNITNERNLKGIRYLLYKRYCEGTLTPSQFEELIQTSVTGNPYLQEQLIDLLLDYHDMEECVRWAFFYEVDLDKLPRQVQKEVEMNPDFNPVQPLNTVLESQSADSAKSGNYHSLRLGEECIHWVDEKATYMECMEDVGRPGSVVGVDGEWRPSFGQVIGPSKMSLLQLGLPDKVYLIDILTLSRVLTTDDWGYLAELFFCNENVTKLGYGLEGDLRMLIHAVPCLSQTLDQISSVIDLQYIHQNILKQRLDVFDISEDDMKLIATKELAEKASSSKVVKKEERGLSELVRLCLGRTLDKSEQLSDWERRPLRHAQIHYAALDAFCLVEVYDVLKEKVADLHLDIPIEPGNRPPPKVSKKTKSEKRQKRVEDRRKQKDELAKVSNPPKVTGAPITVTEFTTVVDTMLQGLGKQLRSCGVDVEILATEDKHDKAAHIARRDNRVILTSGMPFLTLKSQVPEGMCYNVNNGISAKQQLVDVLEHFNVVVSEQDIFSRCKLCNGNKYTFIEPKEMKEAWNMKKRGGQDAASNGTTSPQNELTDNTQSRGTDDSPSDLSKHHRKTMIWGRMLRKLGATGKEDTGHHVIKDNSEAKSNVVVEGTGDETSKDLSDAGKSSSKTEDTGLNNAQSVSDDRGKMKGVVGGVGLDSGRKAAVGVGRGAELQRYWASYGRGRGVMGRGGGWGTSTTTAATETNGDSVVMGDKVGSSVDREEDEGKTEMDKRLLSARKQEEETRIDRILGGSLKSGQNEGSSVDKEEEGGTEMVSDPEKRSLSAQKQEQETDGDVGSGSSLKNGRNLKEENETQGDVKLSADVCCHKEDTGLLLSRNETEKQQEVEYTIKDFLKMGDSDEAKEDESFSEDEEEADFGHIDMTSFALSNGVKVQLDRITDNQFDKIDLFYVCSTCGKVYWDGSHFETVKSQLSYVIEENKEGGVSKSFYDIARDFLNP